MIEIAGANCTGVEMKNLMELEAFLTARNMVLKPNTDENDALVITVTEDSPNNFVANLVNIGESK